MFRRISLVLVWVVAAVAATGIVFAAVSSVAGDVVDQPGPILDAFEDEEVPRVVEEETLPSTSSSSASVTTSSTPATSSSTSTSVASTTDVTSSSAPSSPPAASETKTYRLVGGWVRVGYGPGAVTLDGAGPNSGFTMDVKDSGPDDVEVEFRGNGHRSSVEVQWVDGRLVHEIEERDD